MKKGKVYLVGAGPGHKKLITVRGLEVLKKADVVVYDRLSGDALLKEARKDAEFIYVGKKSANHTMKQENINVLLAKKALEGKEVVRLKGGDPYVFGRGGEECEVLIEHDVEFEVVPGITSAIGGLCYGGIPITHRDYASSFHVITGHLKDDSKDHDWNNIASMEGTLVFLMGVSNLKKISQKLIENGKSKSEKIALVHWATRQNQRVVTGTLENIVEVVEKEKITSPSVIVVGKVVEMADDLNFLRFLPLKNKKVVVTRARAQSSKLVEKLENLGAEVLELPAIKIEKIEDDKLKKSIEEIEKYTHLIFTSINGVKIFFEELFENGKDSRDICGKKIVAIGKATKEELKRYGLIADMMPKDYVAESLFELLEDKLTKDDYILMPRAKEARDYLREKLEKICKIDDVKIYNTVLDELTEDEINSLNESADYITFTSSSTVKNFESVCSLNNSEIMKNSKLISIGPITSNTIKELGYDVYKEAKEYTIDGVIKVIKEDLEV